MSLLVSHDPKLFFFKNLHSTVLKCLAAEDLQDWLTHEVEVEEISIFNLSAKVFSSLHRHEVDWWRLDYFEIFSLVDSNFIVRSLICELLYELISLNLNMLSASLRCICSDVPHRVRLIASILSGALLTL